MNHVEIIAVFEFLLINNKFKKSIENYFIIYEKIYIIFIINLFSYDVTRLIQGNFTIYNTF